jgi:DNA polymerase III alpha subunit
MAKIELHRSSLTEPLNLKQAIKDSTRVLGFPYAVGEKLTKALPPSVMGKDISL